MNSATCKTSVPTGAESPMFRACGKPATVAVDVGDKRIHCCPAHAAAARRFVSQFGNEAITSIQRKVPNGGAA